MSQQMNRRRFLEAASAGMALGVAGLSARADQASNKLVLGVIGTGGRGTALSKVFQQQPGVEIAFCCDVDKNRAGRAADEVGKISGKPAKPVQDLRKVLDEKAVDAVVIATCNHWHAPAAILACSAGKHVYVEKPCSHNPREGELMVQAARKNKRQVQMGNQRRSWAKIQEGIQKVREGAIGRAYFAQSWYTNNRPTIGKGKSVAVPEGLDYDLWQGPAPRRPFRDNYLHYTWHWFWHWGNGELGNNGVHTIDLCRWGLGVDYPTFVSSAGGRYRYDDDQETPDTHVVSYEFADRKSITWEGFSCNRLIENKPIALFQGENGSLALNEGGYVIYDLKGKEVTKVTGSGSDALHIANFLDACRGTAKLNSEIEEGHKSTLLCHLGNIAYRTRRSLKCDPKDGKILGDAEAMNLWQREYEKGWEPKV